MKCFLKILGNLVLYKADRKTPYWHSGTATSVTLATEYVLYLRK